MARTITVEPGPNLKPGEVALWEVHEDHPDGEVMISAPHVGEDSKSVKVARTPGVNVRLSDGRLVEAGRSRQSDTDEDDEDTEEQPARRGRRLASASVITAEPPAPDPGA